MPPPTIQLLIPMSGQGTRFRSAGYTSPKPLIPVHGKSIISRLLENFPDCWSTTFVLADNHETSELPEVLRKERPKGKILFIPAHSKGPSFAVLNGLDTLDPELPVLVSYCDYGMIWDSSHFTRYVETTNCDACIVSYRGYHAHYRSSQMYAYSRMEGYRVVEVKEKGCFTEQRENEFASCGAYYFKSAKLLRDAIEFQILRNLQMNGEYYTSLTVQALIEMDNSHDVRIFEIPGFFQWGTPEDLKIYEYWEKSFSAYYKNKRTTDPSHYKVDQILMPMAGIGTRFSQVTPLLKPLIPIDGLDMFQAALKSLPTANRTVVVTIPEISKSINLSSIEVLTLDSTPQGQALTTEAGLKQIDPNLEVLVSSCDHAIIPDLTTWSKFKKKPDCDAAIFTMHGYPAASANPNSYAYVIPANHDVFPLVKNVSVKKPVSSNPLNDHVLVGTFWFNKASTLSKGISLLKEKGIRVNNEWYLDSIFELLAKAGFRIRMFPLDGFLCWGEPEVLAESLYWQEIFGGYKIEKRNKFPGIPLI